MNFGEALKTVFKKYADFSGRARRSEFWFWQLFMLICFFLVEITGGILGFLFLGIIIPSLAVTSRRLHDIGKSGWFQLLIFIPFGGLVLLYWYCLNSMPGRNEYGPNPKNASSQNAESGETPSDNTTESQTSQTESASTESAAEKQAEPARPKIKGGLFAGKKLNLDKK